MSLTARSSHRFAARDIPRSIAAEARARGIVDSVLQFDNLISIAQYRRAYEITARHVTRGQSVLDWGCGNGHFSFFLESLGADITGYSYNPPPMAMAKSLAFQFVPGLEHEPWRLPFPDASFDASIGVGVLEHVAELGGDERKSLGELRRVTKPGGFLLTFHLPNRDGWIERVTPIINPGSHFHERKYEGSEIRTLWREAGFDVLELGLYNALPRSQVRALPGPIKRSPFFARLYDMADDALTWAAPRVCTNYFVVARRQA